MKRISLLPTLATASVLGVSGLHASTIRVISPSYPNRILPISSAMFTDGSNTITETSERNQNNDIQRTSPVYVTNVTAGNRTLDVFNFSGAQMRDANGVIGQSSIMAANSGIGVINNSAANITRVTSTNRTAFDEALILSTQNSNILNYVFYDGSETNVAAAFDFDLLFYRAFETSDAFLLQERDGNTYYKMTPLGSDGSPILGANILVIGGNTDANPENSGSSGTRHDWNTGYSISNYFEQQSMYFTAVSVEQFFLGTVVQPEDQIVYGFRIDNNGNADVKFFGLSDDTFENNPINPIIPPGILIPEPSSLLLSIAGLGVILRRRR